MHVASSKCSHDTRSRRHKRPTMQTIDRSLWVAVAQTVMAVVPESLPGLLCPTFFCENVFTLQFGFSDFALRLWARIVNLVFTALTICLFCVCSVIHIMRLPIDKSAKTLPRSATSLIFLEHLCPIKVLFENQLPQNLSMPSSTRLCSSESKNNYSLNQWKIVNVCRFECSVYVNIGDTNLLIWQITAVSMQFKIWRQNMKVVSCSAVKRFYKDVTVYFS